MSELIIRPVVPADLTACLTVEQACFPADEAASPENLARRINIFPQGFFVAEQAGRVIGQVNSGATDKDDITDEAFKGLVGHNPAGRNMVIFSLSVLPEKQRRGIAGKLLTRFISTATDLKKSNILLLCKTPLIDYYSRYGFDYVALSSSTHGGAQWHEMALRLN